MKIWNRWDSNPRPLVNNWEALTTMLLFLDYK